MNHGSIPLDRMQQQAFAKVPLGTANSSFSLCKIEKVDTRNRLVSAYFLTKKKVIHDVPYCLPYYNKGCGIIFEPSPGSLALAIPDGMSYIILAFTPPFDDNTRNLPGLGIDNVPDLLEGEVMVSGEGRSFIKFNKLGGFTLSSAVFAYMAIDEFGNYELNVENGLVSVNGTMREEYFVDYEKSMEIIKGIHKSKTSQGMDSSIELCYEIRIGDKLIFGITPAGKVITAQEEENEGRI